GGAAAVVGGVVFLARRLLPRLLETVVRSGGREVLLLGALALCLAMGWLTHSFGFSLALGAFLAGVVLSGSLYSHQVVADVAPFRDLFSGVFFISIGMLLDIEWVAGRPGPVLLAAGGVILLKALTAGAATAVLRFPARTVTLVAMSLAQIGEFSFVLMAVGATAGILSEAEFQLLLSAAVLTLLATPAVTAAARPLALRLASGSAGDRAGSELAKRKDHVVIVGFGADGRLLARVLREARIPYVVIELSGELARAASNDGESIVYGDATREEILRQAGVESANVLVFTISDPPALQLSVGLARRLAPSAQILVRTSSLGDIESLQAAGADQVIAVEFETAIEVFTRVLERYHVPRNVIRAQTRVLRGEGYRMLRTPTLDRVVSQAVVDALAAGTTDLYLLDSASRAAGRSLRELELRRRSGATVIAVVRDGRSQLNPEPDLSLTPGDCLVLMGSHEEIDRAFDLLAATEDASDE
ncbi:MAG: cation:proton antiporter, partial [Thermoanaerobaculia bacterium]|nr:cation:proton antiporter [Thermoanaerobaculia bacterium]